MENNLGNKLTYQPKNTTWQCLQQENKSMHIYNWSKRMSYSAFNYIFTWSLLNMRKIYLMQPSLGKKIFKKRQMHRYNEQ